MTDFFALLQQPRRPWLDEAALKETFLALTAEAHPDRVHSGNEEEKTAATGCFAELNRAFSTLKEPRDRLKHLVELELGRKPGDLKNVPGALADAFMKIAAASRQADVLVREKSGIESPLLMAGFMGRIQNELTTLESLQAGVERMQSEALEQLKSLDREWEQTPQRAKLMARLEELSQILGFHARWLSQLREAHFRLIN